MRVLIVHSGNLFGGIEAALHTLYRHVEPSDNLSIEFALCFDGRTRDEFAKLGATIHKLPEVRISRPFSVIAARRALRQLLQNSDYQAVIFVSQWGKLIFASSARKAGVPVVFWMHDFLHGRGWLQRVARFIRPDRILANSRFTASVLPRHYPDIPWDLFYNPVPPPQSGLTSRADVRKEFGTAESTKVIIQVSRMEEWKGHAYLIDALGRIKESPDWECWIVGGAQREFEIAYMNGLKQQAEALGISDRIRFLGFRSDVPALLAAADVFCQSNKEPEPFGIVFIEAMYARLPVVTFDMGGAQEIVTEETGCLITPADTKALGHALGELIESSEKRDSLGASAVKRAAELCDPRQQAREFARLLKAMPFNKTRR